MITVSRRSSRSSSRSSRIESVEVVVVVVVVVPSGQLGGLWTKCMFFKKRCSRLGQKQLFKSTASNGKTRLQNLKCDKNKKTKRLSPRRDAPFRVYFYIMQTTLRSAAKVT